MPNRSVKPEDILQSVYSSIESKGRKNKVSEFKGEKEKWILTRRCPKQAQQS